MNQESKVLTIVLALFINAGVITACNQQTADNPADTILVKW